MAQVDYCLQTDLVHVQEWLQLTVQPDKVTLTIPTVSATQSVHSGNGVRGLCECSSTLSQSVIALLRIPRLDDSLILHSHRHPGKIYNLRSAIVDK